MTKKKNLEKNPKPLSKPDKAKGLVTLGRSTFIDDIIKKAESQPSIGPRKVASRQPTNSLRAIESPSIAFAEVHSQIEEQDFQEIENSSPKSLPEGNLSNLREGRGEVLETEEPRSPLGLIQTLSNPDKGSAPKISYNKIQEPKSPQTLGTLIILDKESVVKAIPIRSIPSRQPRNTLLDIPEGYWHIFDQMAQNQPSKPLLCNTPL